MSEISKLEIEAEAKCSADKFFDMIKYSLHHLPTIFPESYKSSDIIHGDGNSVGTVRVWKYVLPGTSDVLECKETIKEVDDENRFLSLDIQEGHLKNHYPHFVIKIHVKEKGDGSVVKWTVEYKKAAHDGSDPHRYLDMFALVNQKIEAHLAKA